MGNTGGSLDMVNKGKVEKGCPEKDLIGYKNNKYNRT
jgi:hypothetical protein